MSARSARAARALAHLPEHDPALASLVLWCDVRDGTGPTRTQGAQISIGSEFETLPLREQIGVLGHHILHIALRHSGRLSNLASRQGGHFDPLRFNLAADALVNAVIEAGGHALPRPAVTLETLCMQVLQMPPEQAQVSAWDVEKLYIALSASKSGLAERQESYRKSQKFEPDLEAQDDHAGRVGERDQEPDDADWAAHMERALRGQSAAGRGIGPVLARLSEIPTPQVPWERKLRRALGKALLEQPRRSYCKPRRRWIAAEADAVRAERPSTAFEPGMLRDARQPRIVVGVDSSGSIAEAQLAQFAGEVAGIARKVRAELHLLLFDEKVYSRMHMRGPQAEGVLTALETRRDGGTSFVDFLAEAALLDPSIIVVLTDLDGPMGARPACPVMWVSSALEPPNPPFGDVVTLDM